MRIKFVLIVFIIISSVFSYAQEKDKKKLEDDKSRIEKEIKLTNKLLKDTRKTKKNSLNELVLINRKIDQRKQLIATLDAQIYYLDFSIEYNNGQVAELEKRLVAQKEEYASLLFNAYKNRNSYSRLMFIFSSDNFNQAYQRLKYLQQYGRHRKIQYDLVVSMQDSLLSVNNELVDQKKEKSRLKSKKQTENTQLSVEKNKKNKAISVLSKKEKDLKKEIARKQKAAKDLRNAIQRIIKAEMAKNNKGNTKAYALTPEQKQLASNFIRNKGKLPWPTKTGIISSTFGEHRHPVLKHVTTKNDGVDIQTSKGTEVRAVFEGTVTFVGSIPAFNNAVFIRHGDYLTAYSRLDKIFVKVGDKVDTRQSIGTIFHDPVDNKTELHFEIWKGYKPQNPVYWIAK